MDFEEGKTFSWHKKETIFKNFRLRQAILPNFNSDCLITIVWILKKEKPSPDMKKKQFSKFFACGGQFYLTLIVIVSQFCECFVVIALLLKFYEDLLIQKSCSPKKFLYLGTWGNVYGYLGEKYFCEVCSSTK